MQNTVLIYRIEDREFKGLYCNQNSLSANQDSKRHPAPCDDSAIVYDFETSHDSDGFYVPEHYRFGLAAFLSYGHGFTMTIG